MSDNDKIKEAFERQKSYKYSEFPVFENGFNAGAVQSQQEIAQLRAQGALLILEDIELSPEQVKKLHDHTYKVATLINQQEVTQLRGEVAMLRGLVGTAPIWNGSEGEIAEWVETSKNVLNNTQATAQAYEAEVKAKQDDIAFECAARIVEGRLRSEEGNYKYSIINHEIRKCAAAIRDKAWQQRFLTDYAELRATSKKG